MRTKYCWNKGPGMIFWDYLIRAVRASGYRYVEEIRGSSGEQGTRMTGMVGMWAGGRRRGQEKDFSREEGGG